MDWQVGGVIAAAAAAFGSLLAACFSAWQISANLKQSALIWLYAYLDERHARTHALIDAEDEHAKEQAFIDFLNFLEATTLAYNQDIMPNRLRTTVFLDLCKTIATIKGSDFGDRFSAILESGFDLENTRRFSVNHSYAINRTAKRMQQALPI